MYRLRTLGGFSIERDGGTLEIRVHRKAHALLAVLAAQGSMGRERLMALLWPESDAERAKGSLKQAIHLLRRLFDAPDLLLGTAELRLNPERIESDVRLFFRAMEDGAVDAAVRHYGGPFLDGVHVDGAPDFERWVEAQRVELARKYMSALEQLARTAEALGEHATAVGWWRRLQAADPLDGRVAVNLMLALEASGDRPAAIQHARIHETLLVEECGLAPDPAVAALVERLRSPSPSPAPPPGSQSVRTADRRPAAVDGMHGALDPADGRSAEAVALAGWPEGKVLPHSRRLGVALVVSAIAVLLLGGLYTLASSYGRQASPAPAPVLAVGQFEEHGGAEATNVAGAAADMLATNLARVPGLQVVSSARMHEILAQLVDTADRRASTADAARVAGAGELLEGALHHASDGGLRLTLRRVDVRTGAVLGAHILDGSDVFQLVDRATTQLASGFGLSAAELRLADVTTPSVVAYRLYEEGLRSFAVADYRTAKRLFEAAVAEDSLFAMAAHYLWATRVALHEPIPDAARERLLLLAERAADRERLMIRASWAVELDRHQLVAVAETLAIRYPAEPDGHLLLGFNRIDVGDFLGALPHLRRVVSLDSLGLRGSRPRCRACSAFAGLVNAYSYADSLEAAERVAREWVRHQPGSAGAWASLATVLEFQAREEEALAARRKAATLNPIDYYDALFPAIVRIRTGDFAAADGALRDLGRDGTPEVQSEALWWLTISLRYQGRLHEALAIIRRPPLDTSSRMVFPTLLHEGQVLFELGRFADAARAFHAAATFPHPRLSLAEHARRRSWALTHYASALAAAGDTGRLAPLADTIETWGRRSTLGRDWRLHHHVRGLLLAARGQSAPAAAEFQRAILSPTSGYTRTNLELARALLASGRPREAVSILQPALRGILESSNLYVTHSEVHEWLGRAWEAAGRPDSAVVHYRWVVDAWRGADPELHTRRAAAQARLAALAGERR
jgi:DNA-binding SARP family transcriptional activator/Flp pilus assembly protein TadD